MNRRLVILLTIILLTFVNAFSQKNSNETLYYKAEELLDVENWEDAFKLYSKILQTDKDNANVNFKAGFCLLNNGQAEKAIPYLEKAMRNIDEKGTKDYDYRNKKAPIETYFYLGQAYHLAYKFDESLLVLSKLKGYLNPEQDADFIKKINLIMRYDTNGIKFVAHPVKMIVKNLGDSINTTYSEHSPVFTADESMLFFTSRRENGHKILPDGQYDEDIYYSTSDDDGNWSKAKNIGNIINTKEHDATVSLSIDGRELYLYRDDDNGSIFVTTLDNNNKWTIPIKLPYPINSKYRETHASLGADNMTLYFTSDRPGGYGGLDIYVVRRLPNGKWGIPQNLGPRINTPYDEEGPFIHPDGKTLFFSSKGHNSMGGYDIFYSNYNEDTHTWSKPQNLGYPINTTSDDVFYVPTPDGKRAYYASKQFNSKGKTDIFLITIPGLEEKGLTVLSGYIMAADGTVPQNIVIYVTNVETGDIEGTYAPNPKTGKYLFILRPGKKYNVSVEADGFSYYSENIDVPKGSSYKRIKKVIKLNPIILGDVQDEYFVKFNPNDTELISGIKRELDNMSRFLKVNDTLKLNILLSDESTANNDLNKQRKEKIKEYLMAKGIPADRIFTDKKVPGAVNLTILNNSDTSNKNLTDNIKSKYGKYLIGVPDDKKLTDNQKALLDEITGKEGKNYYYNIVATDEAYANEIKNYLVSIGVPEAGITISNNEKSDAINLIANSNLSIQVKESLDNNSKNAIKHAIVSYGKDFKYNIDVNSNETAKKIKNFLIDNGVNPQNISITNSVSPICFNIVVKPCEKKQKTVVFEYSKGENSLTSKQKQILDNLIATNNNAFAVTGDNLTLKKLVESYLKSKGKKVTSTNTADVIIKLKETSLVAENESFKDYNINSKEVKVRAILFDFDKWQTDKFDDVLYNLYNYMKNNPDAKIIIHGYTDLQGDEDYNIILSRKRAEFVKNYLVAKGINPSNIVIKAHGEANQISIDLNPETRKYNRRVEFEVLKQGNKQKLICYPVDVPEKYKIKK